MVVALREIYGQPREDLAEGLCLSGGPGEFPSFAVRADVRGGNGGVPQGPSLVYGLNAELSPKPADHGLQRDGPPLQRVGAPPPAWAA